MDQSNRYADLSLREEELEVQALAQLPLEVVEGQGGDGFPIPRKRIGQRRRKYDSAFERLRRPQCPATRSTSSST